MDIRFRHVVAIRKGFTLMELLAVMVIIGILAGLITAAVARARVAARNASIKTEISQLENALEAYKNQYGEYPPDFTNQTLVVQHLQNAFPRAGISSWSAFVSNVANYNSTLNINASRLGPSNALVFWLGGMPNPNNPKQLLGFSANAANPFEAPVMVNNTLRVGSRRGPFFDFAPDRLIAANRTGSSVTTALPMTSSYLAYRPDTGSSAGDKSPYLYFRARPAAIDSAGYSLAYNATISSASQCWPASSSSTAGLLEDNSTVRCWVTPYYRAKNSTDMGTWYNPNSFQIICAGLDGWYGTTSTTAGYPTWIQRAAFIPSGNNVFGTGTNGIFDNLTNFLPYTVESEL